jgi:hypothetical protein
VQVGLGHLGSQRKGKELKPLRMPLLQILKDRPIAGQWFKRRNPALGQGVEQQAAVLPLGRAHIKALKDAKAGEDSGYKKAFTAEATILRIVVSL